MWNTWMDRTCLIACIPRMRRDKNWLLCQASMRSCSYILYITCWSLSRMADILQTISNAFCRMKSFIFRFKFPGCSNDNNSALVQVIAWRRIDDKQLPRPIVTIFYDVRHMASLGYNELRHRVKITNLKLQPYLQGASELIIYINSAICHY